ncbi:LssY C-terminal domain-containing protein [Leifsonia sp. F6_8S_P_1B]|uniref:LssY C-terminal domain-containing protein n=1 Tax=Leifsonia williamsii TaxID=3035919 RepID=A0ABT8K866_9MICO|nr:LssY C-terminal domain-containing protein [Leifsonia williamsii]MDN4613655.1 LssY C-terminal domain-containing protein [Leifsonia williamsii]
MAEPREVGDRAADAAARRDGAEPRDVGAALPAAEATAPAEPRDVPKTRSATARRFSLSAVLDYAFFVFGGVAAVWLAWIIVTESFSWGWFLILFFVLFWVVLAYLVLPRLHRILTEIYVPDYFIGRARTSDGLLGDPINLAALGSEAQLEDAMRAAGWTRADDVTAASSRRIITSTLFRRSYDEAPVSPLFLFGHQQDAAYQQEVRGNPAKRHHVRFWRCPDGWLLPGGHHVDWLAAGTFDRAVGFSLFTLQITHKIDADTDIERDHIVSTLRQADVGVEVSVIRDFSTGYHARNGGGDSIETDGDLPILDLRAVATDARDRGVAADADARRVARDRRRPVPTTLGFLLILLRILAGVLTIALTVIDWRHWVDAVLESGEATVEGVTRSQVDLVFGIAMGVFGAGLVFYFVLALLVLRGSNWARIASMSYSALLIVFTAVDYFNGGPQVTLANNLLGLPLDILIVLALSSQRSRHWARLPRSERRSALQTPA